MINVAGVGNTKLLKKNKTITNTLSLQFLNKLRIQFFLLNFKSKVDFVILLYIYIRIKSFCFLQQMAAYISYL